mgnify:FL=1
MVNMSGVAEDRAEFKTKVIDDNGLFKFHVSQPDVAHLTFRCYDQDMDFDDFIAYSSVPLPNLHPGFSSIQLYSGNSTKIGDFEYARLFVRITIEASDDR